MNDKLKAFSFANEVFNGGKRTRVSNTAPELVLVSVEDRIVNKKKVRKLILSIHPRMINKMCWHEGETVDLVLQGDDQMDAVVTPSPFGFKASKTSKADTARTRIMIPVPPDMERFAELISPKEGLEVECADGKIAFKMPF